MKSTDIDRIDREFRRSRKKEEIIQKRVEGRSKGSVGDYIKRLYSLFYHDDKKIYNLKDNADILAVFSDMKQDLPEKQWQNVMRKAIKETKIEVNQREEAFKQLQDLLSLA
jgi:L-rhamnose mutarotase